MTKLRNVGAWMMVLAAIALMPALTSAAPIYTTDINGAVVNQNIFSAPQDVYLSGGPQNNHSNGLTPGVYYFQVTDPSGKTLLSTDLAIDRMLVVNASGRIAGAYTGAGAG